MNVLLVGGGGFLGSHIVEELLELGHFPVVLDVTEENILEVSELTRRPVKIYLASATNFLRVRTLLDNHKIDVVIYLSGISNTVDTASALAKAYEVGVVGLATLYDAISSTLVVHKPTVMIASSSLTASMWGNQRDANGLVLNGATKLDIADCYHPYVDQKIAMEMMCRTQWRQNRIPFVAMRFATLYGPRMNRNVVTWYFIRNALRGHSLIIQGDGLQKRQHMYCKDMSWAIGKILQHPQRFMNKAVSIVPAEMVTVRDIADSVCSVVSGAEVSFTHSRAVDITMAKIAESEELKVVGWCQRYSLFDGIKQTVEYYRKRPDLWREI